MTGLECPHGNRFCATEGWSRCGKCHDDLDDARSGWDGESHVPFSISNRSRVVTWLWLHTRSGSWLHYRRARRLARWLP